jgi:hypothetical protein
MRGTLILAASAIALASCATAPAPVTARSDGGWTFEYNAANGVSTATQSNPGGAVTARITCQAPNGDMQLSDYVVGAGLRGSQRARFTIGQETIEVPAEANGTALNVRLPRRPPNLTAYAHLSRDPVSLSAGGRNHAYAAGAVEKFAQVANSCWPVGS